MNYITFLTNLFESNIKLVLKMINLYKYENWNWKMVYDLMNLIIFIFNHFNNDSVRLIFSC
jgi:hypothetical protein